jgi:hypothetical protein
MRLYAFIPLLVAALTLLVTAVLLVAQDLKTAPHDQTGEERPPDVP